MKTIMKIGRITVALLLLVAFGVLISLTLPAKTQSVDLFHSSWQLVRETATEDAAAFSSAYALATAEGDFAGKDTSTVAEGGPFKVGSVTKGYGDEGPGNRWMFAMCGGAADNNTFSFALGGWAKTNGMAQVICEGAGAIGTQDVVLYPDDSATATNIWWADTITLDEESKWPKTIGDTNGVGVYNSGDNEVALLVVDTAGIEWIQFVFYDCNGSGTEANDVTVYGRRF